MIDLIELTLKLIFSKRSPELYQFKPPNHIFNSIPQLYLAKIHKIFNSHAGGMAVSRRYGFKIDFVRNPIPGSAAQFFVIILKFIFTLIYEIKIFEKKI